MSSGSASSCRSFLTRDPATHIARRIATLTVVRASLSSIVTELERMGYKVKRVGHQVVNCICDVLDDNELRKGMKHRSTFVARCCYGRHDCAVHDTGGLRTQMAHCAGGYLAR